MGHKKLAILLAVGLLLVLASVAIMRVATSSTDLTAFGKEHRSAFLLYAHLSNRVLWIQNGAGHPIGSEQKAPHHHAYPTISSDGNLVAFVRSSMEASGEEIVLHNMESNKESVLLKWPGAIWATAWSPTRPVVAFVADVPAATRQQSLFALDTLTRQVTDLATNVKWVSDYSSPSWSPNGSFLAFEARFTAQVSGVETHSVMVVDLSTKSVTKVADGWFPAWSPNNKDLSYISTDGRKCYQITLESSEKRVLFSYRNLDAQTIIGPVVWAPSGNGVIFNTTSGIEGDGRDSFYVDLASGKQSRLRHDSRFEVVGWFSQGNKQAAL
jgi:Tol biopolymer transport system component